MTLCVDLAAVYVSYEEEDTCMCHLRRSTHVTLCVDLACWGGWQIKISFVNNKNFPKKKSRSHLLRRMAYSSCAFRRRTCFQVHKKFWCKQNNFIIFLKSFFLNFSDVSKIISYAFRWRTCFQINNSSKWKMNLSYVNNNNFLRK